ncbi:helix-turn-helix domain-containing protein, partial [Mammaliicoccus lentus]|uniref:helix-turn-helix domain-containing protein n=1 Tax=Mammaliicoccus lentus TaxID=42858 RepID=UPI002DBE4164
NKKYSLYFKLKLIREYKSGNEGYNSLSKKYNIDTSYIRKWLFQYDNFGVEGLTSGMTKRKYSKDEKLNIIYYRLEHRLSYKETAKVFGIMNPTLIAQWQKKYNDYGILGLESKPKGRVSKQMNKHKNNSQNDKPLNETEREELERLRIQNKKLEIAIELEKKLQSLAQENRTKR